jgi:hypothetical protein
MGNAFTNAYLKNNTSIRIGSIECCWPETSMIKDDISREEKYRKLYFGTNYMLSEFPETEMLMLHNSWTPSWYKELSRDEILNKECTLSNILKATI